MKLKQKINTIKNQASDGTSSEKSILVYPRDGRGNISTDAEIAFSKGGSASGELVGLQGPFTGGMDT